MSDLIEIKIGASIADDSMAKIRQQLAEFEKTEKIKPDMDTALISKKIKEVEKDVSGLTKGNGKKLKIFDEAELIKSGTQVVKVKDTVEKSMREIENSYKSMGETSLVWNKTAEGVNQFTVKVKESESVTKQYKHTMVELADGQKAFIRESTKGSENQVRGVQKLLAEKNKLLTVENQLGSARKQITKLDPQSNEYKKLSTEVERLDGLQKQYNSNLKNIDTTKLKQLQTDTKQLGVDTKKAMENTIKTIDAQKFGGDMQRMGRGMMALSAPILAVGAASVKASIDFESAFAGVRKTTDATEEEFAVLEKGIREMSKSFPQSASAIAGIGEIAGQLGIAKEHLLDFTKVMIMIGDSTNLNSEQAASSIAQFANIVGMSLDDVDKFGSALIDLGNKHATTEADIMNMTMRIAGAGKQIGLTEAEMLSLSTALSSVGIKAEMGGSAFSKVMVNMSVAATLGIDKVRELENATGKTRRELELMSANDGKGFKELSDGLGMTATEVNKILKAGKNLEEFAKIAGMSAEEFKKAFEEDAIQGIAAFIQGLGDAENRGTNAIQMLEDLGIAEVRLRDVLLRSGSAKELFTHAVEVGNEAWAENNALTNEANERYKTAESQLNMLKNTVVDAAIELGGKLAPSIIEVVKSAVELVDKFTQLPESMQVGIIKGALFTAVFGGITSTFGNLIRGSSDTLRFFGDLGGLLKGTAKLSKGTGDAVKTTSGLIGGLASSTGLFVAGALAVVGIVGTQVAKHIKETKQKKEDLDKLMRDIPEINDGHKRDIDYLKETQREFEELNKLVGANGDLSMMSADQQTKYLDMVAKMYEISPSMEVYYNSQGEMIANTRTEIQKLIDIKKEEMKLDQQKVAEGFDGRLDEHTKALEKNEKAKNVLEAEKKRIEDRINDIKRLNLGSTDTQDKELAKVNKELAELGKLPSKEIAKTMEVIDAGLFGIGETSESFKPHLTGFKDGIKELLDVDPSNVDGVRDSLELLGGMAERIEDMNGKGLKMNVNEIRDYISELTNLGTSYDTASKNVYGVMTAATSGEEAFNAINTAMSEFTRDGKITESTSKILQNNFEGIKKNVEQVDSALIKSIGQSDKYAAAYVASQTKMSNEIVKLQEDNQKQMQKISNSPQDAVSTDSILKHTKIAEKASDDMIKKIKSDATEQKSIWEYLYRDLGVITTEQYEEEIQKTNEVTAKRTSNAIDAKNKQNQYIMEAGKSVRDELDNILNDLEKETKSMDAIWNNLSPETKEFLVETSGLKEADKDFKQLMEDWIKTEPDVKDFVAMQSGLDYVEENIETLGTDWNKLQPKEKLFIAQMIGHDLDQAEDFQKNWDELQPEVKQFFAEAVGIEDVQNADEKTMSQWANNPEIKMFIASHGGMDEVRIERSKTDGLWNIKIGEITYQTNEKGAEAARKMFGETQKEWGKIPSYSSKTYETIFKQQGQLPKPFSGGALPSISSQIMNRWTGDDNFKGGLSFVGEKGRELLLFPDGSHDMTGDKAELRNLPKGTKIYNNRDTEGIMSGIKTPEFDRDSQMIKGGAGSNTPRFAKGNAKVKGNPMPPGSTSEQARTSAYARAKAAADAKVKATQKATKAVKEQHKAEADMYEKVNIEISKQNNLISINKALQERAKDGTIAKIRLIQEQLKLEKQHQVLLGNKLKVHEQERKQQEAILSKSGFKFKGQGSSKEITNLQNIKGKDEKVEEAFNKFNELQFTTIPALRVEMMNVANAIQNALSEGFTQQMRVNNNMKQNDHLLAINKIEQDREKNANKRVVLMNEEIRLLEKKAYLSRGLARIQREERDEIEKVLRAQGFQFAGRGDERYIKNPGNLKGQVKEVEELFNKYNEIQIDIIPQLSLDGEGFKDQIKSIKELAKDALIEAMFEESDKEIDSFNYTIERSQHNRAINQRKDPYWQVETRETELKALEGRYGTEYNKGWDYLNEANKYKKDSEQYKKLKEKSEEYFRASRASELEIGQLKEDLHKARLQHIDEEVEANIKSQDELRFQLELLAEDDLEGKLDLTSKIAEEEIKSYSTLKNTVKVLKEQLSVTLYNTDEWHTINKSIDDYNSKLQDSTLELKKMNEVLVAVAQEQAKVRFESSLKNAETNIFGGQTEDEAKEILDAKIKAHEDYIDGEEKALEIARIKKMIEDESLSLTKEQQAILNEGGEVERAKLDRLNKQLEIQKLQNKLENLKSQKTIKQLKKNEDGTFDFEYVADKKAIAETEKDILESKRDLANWESNYRIDQEKRIFEEKQKLLAKEEKILQDALDAEMKAIEAHYKTVMEKQIAMMEMNMALMEQLNSEKSIDGWSKTIEDIMPLMDKLGVDFAELMEELGIDLTDNFDVIFPLLYKMGALNEEMVEGMGIDFEKYVDAVIPVLDEIGVDHEEFLIFMGVDLDEFLSKSKMSFAEYSESVRKKNAETKADVDVTKEALKEPTISTHTVELIAPPPFSMPDSSSTHTIHTVHTSSGGEVSKVSAPPIAKFKEGGKTGSFSGGRVAMLHEKEIVLNKSQSATFEKLIDLMPSIMKTLDTQSGSILNYSRLKPNTPVVNIPSKQDYSKAVGDTISINRVEFPNANDAKEIKEAILGLRERGKQKMR